jgi:hypothetical protein
MDELDLIRADDLDLIRAFGRSNARPDPAARAAARDRLAERIADDPPIVAWSGHPKDEQAVYRYIGRLLHDLVDDDALRPKFQEADTTVRLSLRNPTAQITLRMKPGEAIRIDFGPTELVPDVVMTMDVDTVYGFWLGKVNLTVALARGQIKATGPVAKILKLLPLRPLTKPVFPR